MLQPTKVNAKAVSYTHLLRLAPEVVAGFPVPLRVGNQRRDQLQNVLFAVEIREGVVVVGLFEVDRVQYLDPILIPLE